MVSLANRPWQKVSGLVFAFIAAAEIHCREMPLPSSSGGLTQYTQLF